MVDDTNVFKLANVIGAVPCRLIHYHDDTVVFEIFRAFLEEYFHCIGICIREDKRTRLTVVRTHSTENMSIFSDNMRRHNGPDSLWCPAMRWIRYPSESSFILKEEFYWPVIFFVEVFCGACHQLREFFLNSSCFSLSALGCRGRGITFRHPCR